MYYETKTEQEFMAIVKEANLEDPKLDIEIKIPSELFHIVRKICKFTGNPNDIVAYYMPFEQVVIVESKEIELKYKVNSEFNWDESWKNFKIFIPIEFLIKNKDNYIGVFGWLVDSSYISSNSLFDIINDSQVYITTFENKGAGRVHTVQYC